MFAKYVYKKSAAEFYDKVLLYAPDDLHEKTNYADYFFRAGFKIIHYVEGANFSFDAEKILLIVPAFVEVPRSIEENFHCVEISVAELFPELKSLAVKNFEFMNYDLLTAACEKNFRDLTTTKETTEFIQKIVYGRENISEYLRKKFDEFQTAVNGAKNFADWFEVAEIKAEIDVFAAEYEIKIDTGGVEEKFSEFIFGGYKKLSSIVSRESPVILSRVFDYVCSRSEKFALIIFDGMSNFDWKIISRDFDKIKFRKTNAFALLPTTTAISRQSLLSGKFPVQLIEPRKLSKEKFEFVECAKKNNFHDAQIFYGRGYDADPKFSAKCAAIIINDIDDLVHAQKFGRAGMVRDLKFLTQKNRPLNLIKNLLAKNFDVYITSDHGNTPCEGMGKLMKIGVEVETKSRRMIVLKNFADKNSLLAKYNLIELPKNYLDENFDYLVCGAGFSFDAKGEQVMSHGGMTIDEVIVPFVEVKAVENNG